MRKTDLQRTAIAPWHKIPLVILTFLLLDGMPGFAQLGAEQERQIDSLKQVIVTAEHDTVKVTALRVWVKMVKPRSSEVIDTLAEKIVRICQKNLKSDKLTAAEEMLYEKALISAFLSKGDHYIAKNEYERGINFFTQSQHLSEETGYKRGVAISLYNIAFIYKRTGDFTEAIDYFEQSQKASEDSGEEFRVAKILNNLGAIYDDQGDKVKAVDYYIRSLKINERLDSKSGIGHSLNNIGVVYLYQGDYEKAIEYHTRCLEMSDEIDDRFFTSMMLNNVGLSYKELREDEKAIDYFTRALKICEELEKNFGTAMILNNLGFVYINMEDYKTATSYLLRSIAIKEKFGYKGSMTTSLNGLGEIYLTKNELAKAKTFVERALTNSIEVGNLTTTAKAYHLLYFVYKKMGNDRMALQNHEEYITFRDSVEREENQREVIRQEYKYNYEKQALADSLQNIEAQKLAEAQLSAQKAQNTQQRQQAVFIGIGLLSLLFLSGFIFYRRRATLERELQLEQKEALRLKELDQFKSKLYTNLTHEFRTPLTVILGMAEKLQADPKKFINEGPPIIERNGKNLLRVINQLLDLSKLENNSFKLEIRQGEIIAYLRYILESFHSYANGNNLSLRFFSNMEHFQMDYDEEQIKQVMTNLISNAIKFTPAGGEVGVRVLKENDQLLIEVKDNGIGIPEEALPLIFDRFYQVDGSSTRAHEGTGIGLAHTKELLRLMEGEIKVKSNLHQGASDETSGSVFTIILPIRNTAPLLDNSTSQQFPKVELESQKAILAEISTASTNKELPTVLIIEDNPDVVVYLKSCLEKDYQMEVAYNGTIGIEKAIDLVPDLIISDVMMPGKDGFEVCNTLKMDERTSHIPLVLLTAKADLSSKLEGLERGADAYLAKPFHQEELDIRLKKLLEGRKNMSAFFKNQYLNSTGLEQAPLSEENSKNLIYENAFIQKINGLLEEHIHDENFGLPQLRQKIRMSRSQFFRKIKAITDTAPSDYLRSYRLQKAKTLLEQSDHNVAEAAYAVGFKDPSYFSKIFKEEFGVKPGGLKK